jgi:arylsulfatase
METADDKFVGTALGFIEKAHKADKPFFVWASTTRMHVWTRLKKEAQGRTGVGLYPDGMVEHDDQVGVMLAKLDELGIADNTIVIYSTDNGAESMSWPDGGITPFHGEKGTTFEGGFRVPQVVRWPGVIKPGTIINDIMSHEDWLPTFLAAAGVPDVVEKLKKGYTANGKEWKVHLDGHNFMPFFKGDVDKGPRDAIYYFGQGGELNAIRWNDWKVTFAMIRGNIATGERIVTNWPMITHLRADPYEEMWEEGEMGYLRWYGDNMWLFVPVQAKLGEFFKTIPGYPFQEGSTLSAGGINYNSLKAMKAMKMLEELEQRMPVGQ